MGMMTKGAPDVDIVVVALCGAVIGYSICLWVLLYLVDRISKEVTAIRERLEGEPSCQEGDNCDHPGG